LPPKVAALLIIEVEVGVVTVGNVIPVPVTVNVYGFSLESSLATEIVADLAPVVVGENVTVNVVLPLAETVAEVDV
jgi:uncharacterized protein (DUF697 family)